MNATCTEAAALVLKADDVVRLAAWGRMTFATVGTLKAYASEGRSPADYKRILNRALDSGEALAWTVYAGATISSSPAFYEAKAAKAATAITLEPGQPVTIEGQAYTVRVARGNTDAPRNSDPIAFVPVRSA
jgi:hypothetical protein